MGPYLISVPNEITMKRIDIKIVKMIYIPPIHLLILGLLTTLINSIILKEYLKIQKWD